MKKDTVFGLILVMLTGIGLILSCENGTGNGTDNGTTTTEPDVPSIEIESADDGIKLVLFEQKKIKIGIEGFQDKRLVYSSDDPTVVTVSAGGVVTAVGVPHGIDLNTSIPSGAGGVSTFEQAWGEATITVRTSDNENEINIPVKVTMAGYEDILEVPSLYEQFKDYFLFGSLLDTSLDTGDATTVSQLTKHFNIYTQQNQYKPQSMTVTGAPTATNINNNPTFTLSNPNGDTWANSAVTAGKKIHYHVIIWHEQAQAWWWTALGVTKNDAGQAQSASGSVTKWTPSNVSEDQIKLVLKRWIDQSMNRTVTFNGQTGSIKQFIYSWDVLNEVILSYPERLTERTQHGTWASAGTVYRPTQSVTGRGNWIPDANPGRTLYAWGDPKFTWRDALRYGSSDEEYWDGKRQGNAWVRALGPDAVYLIYKYARLNDPNAILYINDYDTFRTNKGKMIYDMVNDLNKQWKDDPDYDGTMLINAMGAQEHNNIDQSTILVHYNGTKALGPTPEEIEENFRLWASIPNMKLAVSEADVRVYDNGGTGAVAAGDPPSSATPPTLQNQIDQAKLYAEMFRVYLKYSSKMDRVTFWGHNDQNNWMSAGRPLWFDGSNAGPSKAKPAYYAVQKVLNEYKAANP